MSGYAHNVVPWEAPAAYESDTEGGFTRIAVVQNNPATLAEAAEQDEPRNPYEGLQEVLRWVFDTCAVRRDGQLHTIEGMALRLCYLGSLLQVAPLAGHSYKDIGKTLGLTRAAVSKVALELSDATGIRSRIQRSPDARISYSLSATEVHRKKKKPDAPEKTPGPKQQEILNKKPQAAFHHEK